MRDLSLTLLSPRDAHLITVMYKNDPEGARYLGGYDREQIATLVNGKTRFIWIIWAANDPVGFFDLQIENSKGYYAYFVDRRYRHHGIGTRTLATLEEEARNRGLTSLEGSFEPENVASRKTLEKAGFMLSDRPDSEGMIKARKRL